MGIANATRSARPVRVYPADHGSYAMGAVGDGTVGVLDARRGGPAERFASRFHGRHPALVFVAALLGGFVLLALVSILCGLLVTDVLVRGGGLGGDDEGFVRDLVADRTPFLTDASVVGSTRPAAGSSCRSSLGAVALDSSRRCGIGWRITAFVLFGLMVESATYRVTSLVNPRERPEVTRLDNLPADASYPSGHTAAAVVVYAGLVLLITSGFMTDSTASGRPLDIGAINVDRVVRRPLADVPRHAPSDRRDRHWHGRGRRALGVLVFACRAATSAVERRRDASSPGRGSE